MKLKEFSYLVPPQDLVKDSLDVFVVLEDGSNYVVEVTTPKFLEETLMGDGDFLEPHDPYIIVSKLTDEIIKAAIEEYISVEEDSYWLKLYHVIPTLKIQDLNRLLAQKERENLRIEAEVEVEMVREWVTLPFDNRLLLGSILILSLGSLISYSFWN